MAFAERVRRARRRRCCEARFSDGMLILALYELQEVIEDAAGPGSRGRVGRIIHYRPLKLALALGALGAAGLELAEDMRPGAHHGVALLAGVLVVKTCVSIWEARE